ncbi:MnmA/TRMU family protein, partial [Planctomycetota bacterium]
QYLSGVTPNPCVHCNRQLKFELLPLRLHQLGVDVDCFATGHYATIDHDPVRSRYLLRRGRDSKKDQSYFLYQLTQPILARTLLPLGSYHKNEVRGLARRYGLPVAEKSESQDFVSGGYPALFGDHHAPGPIVNRKGDVLGEHSGIHRFTIGQRRGLRVALGVPMYVTEICPESNTVVIGPEEHLYRSELAAGSCNWIAFDRLEEPLLVTARIRHRHKGSEAWVEPLADDRVAVRFDTPQSAITPGQAVVFYDGDIVVGGGLILPFVEAAQVGTPRAQT